MPLRLTQNVEPIPGYTLVERLGSGGFGEVWKARAPGGIPKAIKFIHGSLDEKNGQAPAEQELKALTRVKSVRHPFILGLERVDVIDGQVIIVMELADRSIWDRFKECQSQGLPGIPRPELIRYMNEAAEALDLMNGEYQLQHLDIKPQNLFLVRNHIKVADFGLVKDLDGKSATVTSGITPVYAAPETFEGRVSHFSDQYSLAIVFQELLTGRRPFDGKNARQLLLQHVTQAPDMAALPRGDRAAIGRSLAKTPDQRFPTCGELVGELRRSKDTTLPSLSVPPPPEFNPDGERQPGPRGFLLSALNTPGADATPADDMTKTQARRVPRPTLVDFDPATAAGESSDLWPTERNRPSLLPPEPPPLRPVPDDEDDDDPEAILRTSTAPLTRSTANPCPRCGTPLLAPGPSAWCGSCGYCADIKEEEKPAQTSTRGVVFLQWAAVVLIGLVAAAGATYALGGFPPELTELWRSTPVEPPKPIDTAAELKKNRMAALVNAAQSLAVLDLGVAPIPPDPKNPRESVRCIILGVVADEEHPGKFTHLLVKVLRGDNLVGGHKIDVRGMKTPLHDYINTRFPSLTNQTPEEWEGKAPEDAQWLEPSKIGKLGCTVRYKSLDSRDRFVEPIVENLLAP